MFCRSGGCYRQYLKVGAITIQKFAGLVPRMSPRLLGGGDATISITNKIQSDELRPVVDYAIVPGVVMPPLTGAGGGIVQTLYLFLDKWLAWFSDVNVATGFTAPIDVTNTRIYWTGDGPPKQAYYNDLKFGPTVPDSNNTFPIGINGPTTPPTVADIVHGTGNDLVRVYVYTYYNSRNEESVPSPPSAAIPMGTIGPQTVQITITEPIPADVSEIRIYRSNGGAFVFVAAISPLTPSWPDSLTDLELAGNEYLQSQEYYPPPFDIQGLIGLACGSLAAFHGNSVVFSEPYQPGAWPPAYEKIFDYPVVALGTFGQTCVVATTGYTYLVVGSDPRSFSAVRIPDPYPCVSKRSMVSADNGVIYASPVGLIFVGSPSPYTASSGVFVVTRELMTHEEWQVYNPSTILGVIFDGRYYGFYLNRIIVSGEPIGAGFIVDFSSQEARLITGVTEDSNIDVDRKTLLSDLDFYATASFANPQFRTSEFALHFSIEGFATPEGENLLVRWEGKGGVTKVADDYRPLTWRSKEFSIPYATTFSVGKIIFNKAFPIATGDTYVDGTLTQIRVPRFRLLDGSTGALLWERPVINDKPFRVPSIPARTEWMIEVEGVAAFQLIEVATSYQDLNQRQAA